MEWSGVEGRKFTTQRSDLHRVLWWQWSARSRNKQYQGGRGSPRESRQVAAPVGGRSSHAASRPRRAGHSRVVGQLQSRGRGEERAGSTVYARAAATAGVWVEGGLKLSLRCGGLPLPSWQGFTPTAGPCCLSTLNSACCSLPRTPSILFTHQLGHEVAPSSAAQAANSKAGRELVPALSRLQRVAGDAAAGQGLHAHLQATGKWENGAGTAWR